ncbi:MAG: hypothetical protein GY811_25635, partial [Myxococcales bacterium]|nr:hypothetical protein [Myxococcales bacterium]
MTSGPEYPLVDSRRVGQLRKALLRDIAAMAPTWRGAAEAQGPDRALVEVAARLSEEATRRLDKTPQRDALAFLEMFDIAPPQPVAARGVTVFALKDGQTSPVLAKARTGVTIATQTPEGQTAAFETTQDLRIQPGHIAHLATVDPALDMLGLAPEAVTTLDPDLTVQPTYALSTSAAADDSIVSIDPPVGILPGDLLRIERTDKTLVFATVISFSEDGLTQLSAPLGEALDPPVARLERMQRLDAFAMPDAQEHALYIGDADVLAVKEPATFALRFDPASVAGILASEGAIFEIWGTRETPVEEDTPDWHPLVRLASTGGDLKLFKAWTGPVDEVEVAGRKSRWIRVRTRDPVVPQTDPDVPRLSKRTRVDKVTLGVET